VSAAVVGIVSVLVFVCVLFCPHPAKSNKNNDANKNHFIAMCSKELKDCLSTYKELKSNKKVLIYFFFTKKIDITHRNIHAVSKSVFFSFDIANMT
jgi:hypothetical protein